MKVFSIFGNDIRQASRPKKPKKRIRKMMASTERLLVKERGFFSLKSRSIFWNAASMERAYSTVFFLRIFMLMITNYLNSIFCQNNGGNQCSK